jgi:hypothetical protein
MRRQRILLLASVAGLLGVREAAAQTQCEPIMDLATCPPCPSSTPLCRRAKAGYEPGVNGCGPMKFSSVGNPIPQGYGAADFANGGCNEHDRCYGKCNAAKSACDQALLDDLLNECVRKYPVDTRGRDGCSDGLCFSNNQRLGICRSRARLYYNAVKSLGQGPYEEAQKEACECCCNPAAPSLSAGLEAGARGGLQVGPVCRPGHWVGGAISDTQYKQFPNTHIRTSSQITWTPTQSIPGLEVFAPSGSGTADLFEANGCVATLDPRTVLTDPTNTSGTLTIDRSTAPAMADGDAGIGLVTTLTDCNGMSLEGWPILIPIMAGPLELNELGDAIVGRVVLVDDATVTVVLDVDYRFVPQTQ